MITEKLPQLYGTPTFRLYDENMQLKHEFTKKNLIVGYAWILSRLTSNTSSVMSHIAIGSAVSPPALSNTALGTQLSRVAVVTAGGVVSVNTIKFDAVFLPGVGTGTIAEAGVFNAPSGGTMFSRVVFPAFTKSALDTLNIEWIFTQG